MEKFKPYSEAQAAAEASKMKEKIESGKAENYTEAEKLVGIDKDHQEALVENERIGRYQRERAENYQKFGKYSYGVYETIEEIFREKGIDSKAWLKKLNRFHKLPPEAAFVFKKLEEEGFVINDIPVDLLKDVLLRSFSLIDRNNEYDKDLAQRIGHEELIRWRTNEGLQKQDSFKKIIATLRDHCVLKAPKTKIGQKPRVTFRPKGSYHNDESL